MEAGVGGEHYGTSFAIEALLRLYYGAVKALLRQ
jgi:hypothetical protein